MQLWTELKTLLCLEVGTVHDLAFHNHLAFYTCFSRENQKQALPENISGV